MTQGQVFKRGLTALSLSAGLATAQEATFGTDADADYAADLWAVMAEMNLASDGMLFTKDHLGSE